ncbi:MAG: hypothetical protein QOH11_328 [Solirubrobacteraceae bacterium]|jgi:hypothetical protein|nr:hypothetical protein [Solirubrobacteraceae bacterium]
MPGSPARSQTVHDEAFAVPVRRRRPPTRARTRRGRLVPLHLGFELLFGVALAVVPVVLGLPLGLAALAAIMGALIAVTAVSAPATELPIRGSRLHDRMGIDALLVGLAALLWVVGEEGASLLAVAAGLHAALTIVPGRVGAGR